MKILKFLFKTIIIMSISFVLIHLILFTIAYITPKLNIENANSVFLYDDEGSLFFQGNGHNEWVSLDNISPHVINATLSIEDKNFYNHNGFDYLRILKSFYLNFLAGEIVQGASTITQQYAKNLYLDFDQTWKRKVEEAWLTLEIEMHYDKEKILEGYLNTINYGNGVMGIENAAHYYFEKNASELSLAEATMLVGIPKSPDNYSPLNDEKTAKKRQNLILSSMIKNHYITEGEKKKAYNEKLTYIGKKEKLNLSTLMYYQDAVMDELKTIEEIPEFLLETNGLKIYTNLDVNAQTILENSISNNLKDNQDIQVAAVIVNPSNGNIIALAGGRDYSKSQYNRATKSKRQVGSTMKPFLYYAALENGLTASSTFLSEPTVFTFGEDRTYAPNNYANIYPGKPISMATALAYSDNIYAIKTHLFLGEETLVDTIKRVGIKQEIGAHPSLPLGTEEINIIDYLTGYATLANEGYRVNLHLIEKIEDMSGNVLYQFKQKKDNVLNKNITFIINELLAGTYDYNLVDYNYPTCISIAPKMTKKYALKSGSTDYDVWAIGYNKDLLVGVWNGYDDGSKLLGGESASTRNIWVDIVEETLKEEKDNWYKMPSNVVGILVDPITGSIATNETQKKKILYYLKGTEPLKPK